MLTLTLPARHDLASAVIALNTVRAQAKNFTPSSARASAWLRSTEIAVGHDTWSPHDHVVLFGSDAGELRRIAEAMVETWVDVAVTLGMDVSLRAQKITTGDPMALAAYALKGKLDNGLRGLLARAAAGDADAAERWREVENFTAATPGLRYRQTWGLVTPAPPPEPKQRRQEDPQYGREHFGPYALLNFFMGVTRPQQALMLGTSESTVARLNRRFPRAMLDQVAQRA